MRFSEIIGNEKVKDVLLRFSIEERVGHAYIFEGPKGVGKLSTARAFAQLLLCLNPSKEGACGECKNCKLCETESHPDIRIITNQLYDGSKKSKDILVDTVRNMKNEIYIKPYQADRKVYIVPGADTMNVYAQNSLLKVLEEPPKYCCIILIAENSDMFLPTVLSRAVTLRFDPIPAREVQAYLLEKHPELSEEEAAVVANTCDGSIGKATELIGDEETFELRKNVMHELCNMFESGKTSIYKFMLFLKHNKDEISFIMNVMKSFFRDLLYFKSTNVENLIVNKDMISDIEKYMTSVSENNILRSLEILFKYEDYFSKNINYATAVQCMSMELWEEIHDRGYRS